MNNFWQCWKNDYLNSLRERYQRDIKSEGKDCRDDPQVNDVVLIKDNLPRATWRIARIVELIASKDGKVRSAKIKTSNRKILHRPLNLLYPIEVQGHSEKDVVVKEMDENTDRIEAKVSRPIRKAAIDARRKIDQMYI